MPADILTLEQAAEYLQLSTDEVLNELENERLPGKKIAGHWRINRAALDRLFEIPRSLDQPTSVTEAIKQTPSPRITKHSQEAGDKRDQEKVPENTEQQQRPPAQTYGSLLKPQRFRGEVFAYNSQQRFGYARLPDKSVVWIEPAHFLNKNYIPQLNDKISFEIERSRKGRRARNICLIDEEKSFRVGQDTIRPNKTVKTNNFTHLRPRSGFQQSSSSKSPKKKSKQPMPIPKRVPTPPRSGTKKAQEIYNQAAVARTEGRTSEALRLFKRTIEAGASTHMYEAYVKFLNDTGNRSEAWRIIQQAIEIFPDHAGFYVVYGQMERRSRNYIEAEKIFRKGLKIAPSHRNLRMGLAQVLVQNGTEESIKEAGKIYVDLDERGQLYKGDNYYQRYLAFQRAPLSNKAYEFFQACQMKPGITGARNLPKGVTDLVVDFKLQEFHEAFGLSDAVLTRCYRRIPTQADLRELLTYLRSFGSKDILGVQDNRRFVISKTLAFIVVENSDTVRDYVMNILSENGEAIIPFEENQLRDLDNPLQVLREVLGQYLGRRDLYAGNMPVSGPRFFGRTRKLRELADRVQMGQFVGIYGLRKMGKTSLLYQLRDQQLQTEAIAYVDLEKSASISEGNCNPLYWELERDLYQQLVDPHPKLADLLRLGKVSRFSDLPDYGQRARLFFDEDIRALLDEIQEGQSSPINQLIFILDELEWILPIGQERVKGYLEFFGLLRGLAQTERYRGLISSIVVAANASISENGYWEDRENPVFAFYSSTFLPPFVMDECHEMIRSLGKNMSVYWDDEALDKIFSETGGHPFLARLFCSWIVNEYPTRPLQVSLEMVDDQLIPFLRVEDDKIKQITELLRRNFPDEEKFLVNIALDSESSELSDEALRHLLGYHLIRPDENGKYQITLNLLRRYLRRRAGVRG